MTNKKKATFKTMLNLFYGVWDAYVKGESTFTNDWNAILKDNQWEDEEFDKLLEEMQNKRKAA